MDNSEKRNSITYATRTILAVLGLAVLATAAYSNSFHTSFQYDDLRLIRFNFTLRDLGNWNDILRSEYFRPLTMLSLGLNFQIAGKNPFWYHIVNLALHITAVTWFYLLLRRRAHGLFLPWIAAALVAVHPLATESVTYISSRSTLLCANFYFLAMLSFDSHLGQPRWYKAAGALLFFLLGILSKEEAALIPAAFFLYDRVFFDSRPVPRRFYLTLALVLVCLLAARLRHLSGPSISVGDYFATEVNVWLRYLWLAIFPVSLNVDPEVPALSFRSTEFWISAFAVTVLLILLLRIRKRHPFLTFWGIWFFLNLLASSIFPLNSFMAEHRAYISLFGFCGVVTYLAVGVSSVIEKPSKLILTALTSLVIFYGVATWARNQVWKDPYTLWYDAAQKSPTKPRARLNLANALLWRNEYQQALQQFRFAATLSPNSPYLYEGIGMCYLRMGYPKEAGKNFHRALLLDPQSTDSKAGLGMVFYQTGDCEKALPYLLEAFERRRESALLAGMISDCYLRMEEYDQAIQWIQLAIQREPEEGLWYVHLMKAYFRGGYSDKARKVYAQYGQRFPSEGRTQLDVAIMLAGLGRPQESRSILTGLVNDPAVGEEARRRLEALGGK